MDALDGNAIGGLLIDVFGAEMTAASSTCGTCGATRPVAELSVYLQAPGTVVRCRTCGSVLMVFVQAQGVTCVDLEGLASLSHPASVVLSRTNGMRETPVCAASTQTGREPQMTGWRSRRTSGAAPSPATRIDGEALTIAKDPARPKVPGDDTFRALSGTVSSWPNDNWLCVGERLEADPAAELTIEEARSGIAPPGSWPDGDLDGPVAG